MNLLERITNSSRIGIFIILILFTGLFSCKKTETVVDASNKDSILKVIESESKLQNLNSVAFCVVKNDSLIWADAIGYANKKAKKAASADTRYLIASISKAITAVAAMQLYEQNKLDLDADISNYLPYSVRNPNHSDEKITVRQLLNHSSSISDDHVNQFDFNCWGVDCALPLSLYTRNFLDTKGQYYSANTFYTYAPGTKGNYTNLGYALLGYIVEQVANKPFDVYCKQQIFLPLGMTKTEWRIAETPLNEWAVLYSPSISSNNEYYSFPDYPDGGLKTTVNDLSKFLRMLILKGTFKGKQILKPGTVDLMEQPTLSFSVGPGTLEYGLGMFYTDLKGKKLYGHSGGEQGASTGMYFDPSTNVGVIVFTNTTAANISLIINSLYQYGNQ